MTRAQPQFEGHYQPHRPQELGYYDLRVPEIQGRQVELAKAAGIGGFCFYFYWFAGRTLLENPVRQYLEHREFDLPFCLCWANENWTRRWDGLADDILINQDHTPEDDLAFIRHVATYLKDPRYIRVDGKPLLMVYRPSLLPEAKATVGRWRKWCRDNGIGEIFLGYTQSFENVDPRKYDFDAAVEFPPNNSAPPNVTDAVKPLRENFACKVYDWRVFIERSRNLKDPDYTLFRSVCPGWDNTARRNNKSIAFVNNSPKLFGEWLSNVIEDTTRRFSNLEKRLVFVNAWNEWAEGAHLEPDERYGYAWLAAINQAFRQARTPRLAARRDSPNDRPVVKAAAVVHAFYPDVFDEILSFVAPLPGRHKLFVTTIAEHEASIRAKLERAGRDFTLLVVENRGRDVLPFAKAYSALRREGFDFVAKVHTKKSPHRRDGTEWGRDMYAKLLEPVSFERALSAMALDDTLGMIGPDGHFVSMTTYLGSNEARIMDIGRRMGLTAGEILANGFFAGTMFIARAAALDPLMELGYSDEDFECEDGRVDGTLAHAFERGFGLSVHASGHRLVSMADLSAKAKINARYTFA